MEADGGWEREPNQKKKKKNLTYRPRCTSALPTDYWDTLQFPRHPEKKDKMNKGIKSWATQKPFSVSGLNTELHFDNVFSVGY